MIPWREEDSHHGPSGGASDGLHGGRASASCGVEQACEPEPAASVAGCVLDGMNRTQAARIGGMDRQTLRDWVHRFNAHGPDGLKDNWANGSVPRLSPEQQAELADLVETGPDRAVHGVVPLRQAQEAPDRPSARHRRVLWRHLS